jgi:preflagellin peptidase FlaK
MLEVAALAIAFIGSSIAAVWDLKTTEVPDEISFVMIAAALLIYGTQSLLAWNYWPFLNSCIVGSIFLGFGFLMYRLGQWGGADMLVLAAIGFLLPTAPSLLGLNLLFPFPLTYIINVFLVGAVYMLIYAGGIAAMNKKVIKEFKRNMKASAGVILAVSGSLFTTFLMIGLYLSVTLHLGVNIDSIAVNSLVPLSITIALIVIWKFARAVENVGFKKKISVSKLKVGDVLMKNALWKGVTKKELRAIRKKKKHVWIKEGVRFAPAFPLGLLITVLFGDALILFVKFFV